MASIYVLLFTTFAFILGLIIYFMQYEINIIEYSWLCQLVHWKTTDQIDILDMCEII